MRRRIHTYYTYIYEEEDTYLRRAEEVIGDEEGGDGTNVCGAHDVRVSRCVLGHIRDILGTY